MHIHTSYLKKQLSKRKDQKLYELKPIGSAIRYKRVEKGLTLEEASEGICSISYLSKLENNQIMPSPKFMFLLNERFSIQESLESDLRQYEEDKIKIVLDLLLEQPIDHRILTPYEQREDYQAYLIQMAHSISFKHYEEAYKKYQYLRGYVVNLMDDELNIFFILTAILLYQKHHFCESYELLLLAPELDQNEFEKLNILKLKMRLNNAFRMNKTAEIHMNYQTYIDKLLDHHYYQLMSQMKIEHITYEASYLNPHIISKSTQKMNQFSDVDKAYIHAKSHYHQGEYRKVYDLTKLNYHIDSHWLSLHLMTLDKLHDVETIKLMIDKEKEFKTCVKSTIIMNHLRHKYSKNKDELLNYLRTYILGYNHISDDYDLLDYLMMDAQYLFSKHQFYKEAALVTMTMLPRLKTLNQAN